MPKLYSGLVTAFESRDEKNLTIEYVGKILDEYQRRTEASATNESNGEGSDTAMDVGIYGRSISVVVKGERGLKVYYNRYDQPRWWSSD